MQNAKYATANCEMQSGKCEITYDPSRVEVKVHKQMPRSKNKSKTALNVWLTSASYQNAKLPIAKLPMPIPVWNERHASVQLNHGIPVGTERSTVDISVTEFLALQHTTNNKTKQIRKSRI